MKQTTYLSAILWVLFSTFLWTLVFAAGKFANGQVGVFQISLLRYVGAFLTLLMISGRSLPEHKSTQPAVHLARAVCGCGAAVAITWASSRIPLIDATAIGMLYGVFAVLLGVVFLRETVGPAHWCAVVVSLGGAGLIVISQGAFGHSFSLWPVLAALLSAGLFAIEGVLIVLLGRAERALTVMLYVNVFGLCLMAGPALWEWQHLGWAGTLVLVLLGPVGVVAQYCTIRGYRSAPLSVVAPVDYAWLPFSALLGLVAFQEKPGIITWLGSAAILAGGVLLVRASAAKNRGQKDRSRS